MKLEKVVLCTVYLAAVARAVTFDNVEQTFDTLQTWYNSSIGLWMPSTGWWNSANCMTMLANYASINEDIKLRTNDIWDNIFTQAAIYNAEMTATIGPSWRRDLALSRRPRSYRRVIRQRQIQNTGFLNDFYDDEGWWALAWIQVYDLTNNSKYLAQAMTIFNDMNAAWNTTPVGGLWWNKQHYYVNAIANELYFSVAAHLANRCPQDKAYYTSLAQSAWAWFYNSGMMEENGNIKDGLPVGSQPGNPDIVWSYNQGVILTALAELTRSTGETGYTDLAVYIADAALTNLTFQSSTNYNSAAILRDPCEGVWICGNDAASFKGIFARNLAQLHAFRPDARYAQFLKDNADSLWDNGLDQYNRLSLSWSGTLTESPGASSQCSGMDLFVGAISQLGEWES